MHRYRVVDVFTEVAMEGNPLAVFPYASGLDAATMQKIAQELNLSETAFVLPAERPGSAARVRIFTPRYEMKFAGHPTIGTAQVLLDEGIVAADTESFVLDELIGPVPVRVEPGNGGRPLIWLRTPPIAFGQTYAAAVCAEALGLTTADLLPDVTPQWVSAGNPNLYIALRDQNAVDRAWIERAGVRQILGDAGGEPICIFVFTPTPEGAYSRMFAPEHGVVEDPATGSATGPLAAFLLKHGLTASRADGTRMVSEQGTKMGRRSLLHIQLQGLAGTDGIDVGGYVTPLVDAVMRF